MRQNVQKLQSAIVATLSVDRLSIRQSRVFLLFANFLKIGKP